MDYALAGVGQEVDPCAGAVAALTERLAREHSKRHGLPVPDGEQIDEFFRYGMWLNVAAAMGVEDLSAGCEWVRAERNK